MEKQQKKKEKLMAAIIFFVIVGLIAIMLVDLVPLFKNVLNSRHNETQMIDYIKAYGTKGIPILIGLQALQVIIVFFPAAAIQVLAGLCYGIWLGSLVCIVGCIIGNILVFTAVRQFKKTFSSLFASNTPPKTKIASRKFLDINKLRTMPHPEYMAFLLYLIPGIPNGPLPYLFAHTPISFVRYLVAVTVASIPSVLFCTWLGQLVAHRNYLFAGILTAIAAAVIILLIIFRKKIEEKIISFSSRS